jgi:hypothetical protein
MINPRMVRKKNEYSAMPGICKLANQYSEAKDRVCISSGRKGEKSRFNITNECQEDAEVTKKNICVCQARAEKYGVP